jgi:hypothetical protein
MVCLDFCNHLQGVGDLFRHASLVDVLDTFGRDFRFLEGVEIKYPWWQRSLVCTLLRKQINTAICIMAPVLINRNACLGN